MGCTDGWVGAQLSHGTGIEWRTGVLNTQLGDLELQDRRTEDAPSGFSNLFAKGPRFQALWERGVGARAS